MCRERSLYDTSPHCEFHHDVGQRPNYEGHEGMRLPDLCKIRVESTLSVRRRPDVTRTLPAVDVVLVHCGQNRQAEEHSYGHSGHGDINRGT